MVIMDEVKAENVWKPLKFTKTGGFKKLKLYEEIDMFMSCGRNRWWNCRIWIKQKACDSVNLWSKKNILN